MSTTATMTTDHTIQVAVENELHWAPDVEEAAIGVSVQDRVVTLSGQVTSYLQKRSAAKAALRIQAVTALANDVVVRFDGDRPTDSDIATAARAALDANSAIPAEHVKVEVRDRYAVLTGEVMWNYQREAARKAVCQLTGIHAVDNRIRLTKRPTANVSETAGLIRAAISRQAAVDGSRISVIAKDDSVELSGRVTSWAEKHQAELAAWSSPHVLHVHNHIEVAT